MGNFCASLNQSWPHNFFEPGKSLPAHLSAFVQAESLEVLSWPNPSVNALGHTLFPAPLTPG